MILCREVDTILIYRLCSDDTVSCTSFVFRRLHLFYFHVAPVIKGRSTVEETVFWKNYFYHCNEAKKAILESRNILRPKCSTTTSAAVDAGAMGNHQSIAQASTKTTFVDGTIDLDTVSGANAIITNNEISIGETGNSSRLSTSFLSDDSSLIPASLDEIDGTEDDSSFVIPSAPNSVNTFTTTRSIDDLVLIG